MPLFYDFLILLGENKLAKWKKQMSKMNTTGDMQKTLVILQEEREDL